MHVEIHSYSIFLFECDLYSTVETKTWPFDLILRMRDSRNMGVAQMCDIGIKNEGLSRHKLFVSTSQATILDYLIL